MFSQALNYGTPPPGARAVPMPQDGHWLTATELRQFAERRTLHGKGVLASTAGALINWHLDGRMIHQEARSHGGAGQVGYESFPYSYSGDALCWRFRGEAPCARVRRLADGTHVVALRGGNDFLHVVSSEGGDPRNLAVVAPQGRQRQSAQDAVLRGLVGEFARPEDPELVAKRRADNERDVGELCRSRPRLC